MINSILNIIKNYIKLYKKNIFNLLNITLQKGNYCYIEIIKV